MTIVETLFTGRPEEKRSDREERCYDLLDSLCVEYFRVDHEHADTIPDCELVEGLLGCRICKNLFLTNRQQTDFYLLIMPGDWFASACSPRASRPRWSIIWTPIRDPPVFSV